MQLTIFLALFHFYEEPYHLRKMCQYHPKDAQGWLQEQQDYLSGRYEELDQVSGWIGRQTENITMDHIRHYSGMLDCVTPVVLHNIAMCLWIFRSAVVCGLVGTGAPQPAQYRTSKCGLVW